MIYCFIFGAIVALQPPREMPYPVIQDATGVYSPMCAPSVYPEYPALALLKEGTK